MITKFKNYLEINGYAEQTVTSYARYAERFASKNIEPTRDNINAYLLEIKNNFSPETVNYHQKALRKYFDFLNVEVDMPKILKVDKIIPDIISEKYFLNNIIPLVNEVCSNRLKAKAVLFFLFYTGVRKSEILSLRRENINLETGRAKIYVVKKKEERFIILPKPLIEVLTYYFQTEAQVENAFNMNIGGLNNIFNKLKPHLPDIKFRPHLLRHSYASHYLNEGLTILQVKDLLGHSSLTSTMRYTATTLDGIQEKIEEIEKKKGKKK